MPIYEYRCRKCGRIFEKIQKVEETGDSLTCPYCGGQIPEKVLSRFSSSKGMDAPPSCGPVGGSRRFTPHPIKPRSSELGYMSVSKYLPQRKHGALTEGAGFV